MHRGSRFGAHGWVLFFLILCSPSAVGASDLSFSECLTIMTENNEAILAAREEEHQYEAERAVARGLHLPRVAIDATYTRLDEPIEVDMEGFREDLLNLKLFDVIPILSPGALPSLNLMLQDDEFVVAMLTATWPVFTGGRILAANRAARARLEESREQKRTTTYHLTSELARRYFGLRMAERVREVRRQVLEGMNQHLYQARRLEEEGLIARGERLHANVAQAEADRELKGARRDVRIAEVALANILAVDEPVTPTSPLFLARIDEPLAEFIRSAMDRHPGLRQVARQKGSGPSGIQGGSGPVVSGSLPVRNATAL